MGCGGFEVGLMEGGVLSWSVLEGVREARKRCHLDDGHSNLIGVSNFLSSVSILLDVHNPGPCLSKVYKHMNFLVCVAAASVPGYRAS
jgi:hypothetical protein